MYNQSRYDRVRKLIRLVNQRRKRQAKQIDILCNDFIIAHRNLIKKAETLCFAANFYQSIIAAKNLEDVLDTAGALLKNEIKDAAVVFFLKQGGSFNKYCSANIDNDSRDEQSLESFITTETASSICRENYPCNLDEMMNMGLQIAPVLLGKLTAFAVPLLSSGSSIGFILIYRKSDKQISLEQIDMVNCISFGLARAIASCQTAYSKN